jgi:hypothetical protein
VPHYTWTTHFRHDYSVLTPEQRTRFLRTVRTAFVPDLVGGTFRKGLRVKRVRSTKRVWEMTYAPDGRATFEYGAENQPGVPHVVWRRVGDHGVLNDP